MSKQVKKNLSINRFEFINILRMYKQHKVLWDKNHPEYFGRKAKLAAVNDIFSKFNNPNFSFSTFKAKIFSIRNMYIGEKRRLLKAQEEGRDYNVRYWYKAADSFLNKIDYRSHETDEIETNCPTIKNDEDGGENDEDENDEDGGEMIVNDEENDNAESTNNENSDNANSENEEENNLLYNPYTLQEHSYSITAPITAPSDSPNPSTEPCKPALKLRKAKRKITTAEKLDIMTNKLLESLSPPDDDDYEAERWATLKKKIIDVLNEMPPKRKVRCQIAIESTLQTYRTENINNAEDF